MVRKAEATESKILMQQIMQQIDDFREELKAHPIEKGNYSSESTRQKASLF